MNLKPCPCGKVPEGLNIGDDPQDAWRVVMGNCCNEWMVAVRIGFYKDKATTYSMCVEAWNAAPRGEK